MFFQLSGFSQKKINDLDNIGWSPRRPGGGTPDFKFEGMIEWGQIKSNPKKSLGQNITPPKSHAECQIREIFFQVDSQTSVV